MTTLFMLLRYRGNPEVEGIYMQTPFSLAIKYNHPRCFELLSLNVKGAGRHLYQRNLKAAVAQHLVDVERLKVEREEERQRILWAAAARKSRMERAKMLGLAVEEDGD